MKKEMKKIFNFIHKCFNPNNPKWLFPRYRWRFKVLICISFFSLLFTFLIIVFRNLFQPQIGIFHSLVIDNKIKLNVEFAQTDRERAIGLSGREKIENDQGMLFVYDRPAYYSFWMKGMKFDIDFIWINNKRIVDVTENVSHLDQQKIYLPREPVDRVLEVKAGFTRKYGIRIGDKVE